MKRLEILLKVLKTAYGERTVAPSHVAKILVRLSAKSRVKGVLSLQEDEHNASIPFLRQAIGLLVDGCDRDQVKEALSAEMYFFSNETG